MKKLNVICASIAALFAASGAIAGVASSTPNLVAVENFGGTGSAATDTVAGGPISMNMSNIAAINDSSVLYFTIRLGGGTFVAAPIVNQFKFAGAVCAAARVATTTPGCVLTLSADRSTLLVTVTAHINLTLGVNAFSYTPGIADIRDANVTLAQTGTSITASIGVTTIAPTLAALDLSTAQATFDSPIAIAPIVTSARAITAAVSGAVSIYPGFINLLASPPGSDFTTPGYAILGRFAFTNTNSATPPNSRNTGTSPVLAADGVTVITPGVPGVAYTLASGSGGAPNTGVTVTVRPGEGQAFPIGSQLSLSTSSTCATVFGTQSAVLTPATATGLVTLTAATAVTSTVYAAGPPVVAPVGTPYFVCVTSPSMGNTAAPIQATITATVAPASPKDLIGSASGLGFNLGFNGSTVEIATYWPGILELQNTGYAGYVKLTNTGSVAAPVSAAHISPANGSLGTSAVVNVPGVLPNGLLAAGQSVLLSTRQVDAAIGAAPSGFTSGRVRFTAPTNGLRVQSLLQNVAGNATPVEYKNPATECRATGGGGTIPAVVGGNAAAGSVAAVTTTCTSTGN